MKTKIIFSRIADEAALSSAQIVGSNDDLLTEILLRLPIRSLICFKSVSKHWNSLIEDPRFCLLRNPNPNPAVGIFYPCCYAGRNPWIQYVSFSGIKSSNPPFSKLGFNKRPSDIRIDHSCNGLLLCRTRRGQCRYYVYNPTINKFSTLPKLDGEGEGDWISSTICGMSLAFDPAKSPHYKVVCVRSLEYQYRYQVEVYSSETGGPWRKCGEPFTANVIFENGVENGVYWNGAIHWLKDEIRDSRDSLYFNIDDQILRVMPLLPLPDASDWRSNYCFWESCDHLHYIIDKKSSPISFNVYEMRRDYFEWFVKYQVDISPVVAAYPEMTGFCPTSYHRSYFVFSLVRGEKDEDSFLVLNFLKKAIRYNIVYQTFETIFDFASGG